MIRCGRGFSLLELLLALGTLAVTLLLVVALGLSVAGRNQQTLEAPVGLVAAEDVLNQFVYGLQSNPTYQPTFFSKATTVDYATDTITIDHVNFAYSIDLEALSTGGTSLNNTNHLMKITARVRWQQGAGPNQGKHQCDLSRLLHEDS